MMSININSRIGHLTIAKLFKGLISYIQQRRFFFGNLF